MIFDSKHNFNLIQCVLRLSRNNKSDQGSIKWILIFWGGDLSPGLLRFLENSLLGIQSSTKFVGNFFELLSTAITTSFSQDKITNTHIQFIDRAPSIRIDETFVNQFAFHICHIICQRVNFLIIFHKHAFRYLAFSTEYLLRTLDTVRWLYADNTYRSLAVEVSSEMLGWVLPSMHYPLMSLEIPTNIIQ